MSDNSTFGDWQIMNSSIEKTELNDISDYPTVTPEELQKLSEEVPEEAGEENTNKPSKGRKDKITGGFKDERTSESEERKISFGQPEIDIVEDDLEEAGESEGESSEEKDEDLESGSESGTTDKDKDDTDDSKQENLDNQDKDVEEQNTDDISDLEEVEPEVAAYLQEKLYDELGFDFKEGEKKFESVKDVANFIREVVEENSIPNFANTEVQKLNDYVTNGGKIEKYFENIYTDGIDVNSIDIDQESNQRAVLKEQLKLQGFSQNRIDSKLKRAEETGILKEEAEDAVEFVKKYREENSEKLLGEQQKVKEVAEKQQQKFYDDVVSNIEGRKDIMGSNLSNSDKKKAVEYIFRADKEGRTQFQKDTMSPEDFVEIALIKMKQDSLIKNITRRAESQAARNLKDKLRTKTKYAKNSGEINTEVNSNNDDALGAFSRLAFKKP